MCATTAPRESSSFPVHVPRAATRFPLGSSTTSAVPHPPPSWQRPPLPSQLQWPRASPWRRTTPPRAPPRPPLNSRVGPTQLRLGLLHRRLGLLSSLLSHTPVAPPLVWQGGRLGRREERRRNLGRRNRESRTPPCPRQPGQMRNVNVVCLERVYRAEETHSLEERYVSRELCSRTVGAEPPER